MVYAQQLLYDEIVKLPFDKVGKVLSFVRFLEQEPENDLIIERDEEDELNVFLESNDFVDSSNVLSKIEKLQND